MSGEPVFTTRREFLSGSLTLLSAAATLPVFLGRTGRVLAMADPSGAASKDSHPILVIVQLAGGNDGLNTIVPVEMDAYYKNRPRLSVAKRDALKLERGLGLHPAASGLKELFDEGRMAVIQGVGYPNPNRSHFSSMDIWHTADPELRTKSGWLGRYFDSCCAGEDPAPEPIDGVALMRESPLALMGEHFMPMSFENPDDLAWKQPIRDPRAEVLFRRLNNTSGDLPAMEGEPELAAYLQRAALKAQVGAEDIRSAAGSEFGGGRRVRLGRRGDELARSLQLVAKLIKADLPTKIYYVSMGGFDTHTGQEGRHRQLMEQLGEGIKGFMDALDEDKLLDRVLVMTFSEFGRRVQENASAGTDHGEAAPMFLFGSRVKAGIHGDHPSLSELHRGDLKYSTDFRQVYAGVLRDWMKLNPQKVLRGGGGTPLNLIKRA